MKGDIRYIPTLAPAREEDPLVSQAALQEQFRKVWEMLAYLEGRLGEVTIRDSIKTLGGLSFEGSTGGTSATGVVFLDTTSTRLRASEDSRSPQDLVMYEACRVYSSAAVVLADNVGTLLTFDTTAWDTFGGFSLAAPTRITITNPGTYILTSHVSIEGNAVGQRYLHLNVGTTRVASQEAPAQAGAGFPTNISCTTVAQLVAGDYITTSVFQNSGGPLNALAATSYSPILTVCRLI